MNSLTKLLKSILAVVNLGVNLIREAIEFLVEASKDHQSLGKSVWQMQADQAAGFLRLEKLIGDPDVDAQASPELTELADHLEAQAAMLRAVVDQFETFVNQNPGTQPVK